MLQKFEEFFEPFFNFDLLDWLLINELIFSGNGQGVLYRKKMQILKELYLVSFDSFSCIVYLFIRFIILLYLLGLIIYYLLLIKFYIC